MNLTAHLFLIGAGKKTWCRILKFPGRGPLKGNAPSPSELQGTTSIHLHPAPPRPCMVDGEIAETWRRCAQDSPPSTPQGTPACQVRSTERRGLVFDLLVFRPGPGSPGTTEKARTSEARVQPVKCSLSSLKGFRGGEGWEGASSKNKFSRKRQLVSTLSRSISRYSY